MKLNPFNKKSTAYYDKVKAEYDKLDREITAAKEDLQKAPAYDLKDLLQGDGQAGRARDLSFDYFKVPRTYN